MPTLRSKIIRLAHAHPELQPHLLPLLKQAIEFPTQDALDAYMKEHPDADPKNHSVVESTQGGTGDKVKSTVQSTKAFLNKITGISKQMTDAVLKAPAGVQSMITDPKARKEAVAFLAKGAKAAPKVMSKRILKSAKKELHELHHAAKAVAKVLKKPPQKWTKEDRAALYSAGAYVAGAVIAASGGGPLVAVAAVGKSFALHVGIKAVHEVFDAGFLHYEWAESVLEVVHSVLAAEKDDPMEGARIHNLTLAVGKVLDKGISDEDMNAILTEKHPSPDDLKEPQGA